MRGFPKTMSAAMAIMRGRYPRGHATREVMDYIEARRARAEGAAMRAFYASYPRAVR